MRCRECGGKRSKLRYSLDSSFIRRQTRTWANPHRFPIVSRVTYPTSLPGGCHGAKTFPRTFSHKVE